MVVSIYKHINIYLFRVFDLVAICVMVVVFPSKARPSAAVKDRIILAKDGKAQMRIVLFTRNSGIQQFAASELQKYLLKISGDTFIIDRDTSYAGGQIRLTTSSSLKEESYVIRVQKSLITLTGGSGRAVLYAVYDFLGRLGCHWLAPNFSFYKGHAEFVPFRPYLVYNYHHEVKAHPIFNYRKIDAFGKNDDLKSLKAIIEWMPKVRLNTFQVPFGKDGQKWNKWRQALIPELQKRGLIIEVGGHGYQNFLNADMDSGNLIKQHPDWFGKDSACNPSRSQRIVFNTQNPEAVHYFISRIINYLHRHPEIKIFDLWPPDGAKWFECAQTSNYAPPSDIQANLANQVDDAVKKKIGSNIRLEIIAYEHALFPPQKVELHPDILVDFCPINQNFEKQIYDRHTLQNADYAKALHAWRRKFSGDIGLYSYFRKAAWRSLPNIIPHYMQRDMLWYARIPLQGISCYAKHDDWFTYEMNHFTFGALAWNPHVNVDSLITLLCKTRYGQSWKFALSTYLMFEKITRTKGSIPFSSLKSVAQINTAEKTISQQISTLNTVKIGTRGPVIHSNLSRLSLMLSYLKKDLEIQKLRAAGAPRDTIKYQIEKLQHFLTKNKAQGVFQLSRTHQRLLLLKHYGLTNQSLLDL